MLGETYKQLGQFQQILKKCILDRFAESLSQEKKDLLTNTNFVIESELVHFKTGTEIQGKILRSMLDSIINIKCVKEFTLENNTSINIPYGDDIEEEIIEFYASNIADKYKFSIDSKNSNLSQAYELIDILGSDFDKVILNNGIEAILGMESVKLFAETYNTNLLSPYGISPIVEISDDEVTIHPDPTEEVAIQETPIAAVELVEPLEEVAIQETPIVAVEPVEPVEEVVPVIPEVTSVPVAQPTSEEVNIDALVAKKEMETIAPIATEEVTVQATPALEEDNKSILSDEKYKELCMKYARNEELTEEEYDMLLKSTPELDSDDGTKLHRQNAEIVDNQDVKVRGFALSSLSVYFVLLSFLVIAVLCFILL